MSALFDERIEQIGRLNPDFVLVDISSNDLSKEEVDEIEIADRLMKMSYLVEFYPVKSVVFILELKRDIPKNSGRVDCSAHLKYSEQGFSHTIIIFKLFA